MDGYKRLFFVSQAMSCSATLSRWNL